MPENCTCCPMVFTADVPDYYWCAALEQEVEQGLSRPKECPIICPLPDGHGRLVDKDEMLKKIENYHRYMTIGRESDPRCIIEDSPTIVPTERSKV